MQQEGFAIATTAILNILSCLAVQYGLYKK